MADPAVRDKLARIASRPPAEWANRVEHEFPGDPAMRMQALLWLHAEAEGPDVEGAPPSLGEAADERYELTLRLDTGATASVWQAVDRRLGRNVAIKVFHEHNESETILQVLAEARAASDVVSEHVVRVLDVQYGDGHPYIVMELVSEYDPDKEEIVLGTAASSLRPRGADEVARWVMHVARGVHEAHLRNVFHRDLKPKNVLITPNSRRARVADFGLAVSGTSADTAHPAITLLKRGPSGPVSVRGTPEYMAPEQARGLPLTLDARTAEDRAMLVAIDVWGLGAIAYELLSGRSPWFARRADDLSAWEIAASTERPLPLERMSNGERIPTRLRRVVDKAMATDPKQRYASAAAIANELQAYLAQRPTSLDRSRLIRFGLWCKRNPQLAVTALLAIGLSGLAAGTRARVISLLDERAALDREVALEKAEEERLSSSVERLSANVERSRAELVDTQHNLATERQNLTNLEKSLADERSSYQTLLEAKEQALRDATTATRKLVIQLDAARRDKRSAEQARAELDRLIADLRRDAEKTDKDRDRLRREREAARLERDSVRRERDAAIAEREAVETQLRATRAELERELERARQLAKARPRAGERR